MATENTDEQGAMLVRMHLKEFAMPPIRDALVLGADSPIGSEALRRALSLLHVAPFDHVAIEDDVVTGLLVRESILKKISEERLVELVKARVKPVMTREECVHLEIDVELISEDQL